MGEVERRGVAAEVRQVAVEGDPEEEGEGEEGQAAPPGTGEAGRQEAARRAQPVDEKGGGEGEDRRQEEPQLRDPPRFGRGERHQVFLFCR